MRQFPLFGSRQVLKFLKRWLLILTSYDPVKQLEYLAKSSAFKKHKNMMSCWVLRPPWAMAPKGQAASLLRLDIFWVILLFIFVPWVNITNDPQDDLAVLPGKNTADYGASWITALAVARLESLSFSRRRRIMLLPTWPWHQRWGWGAWGAWGAGNTAVRRVLRIKWEN